MNTLCVTVRSLPLLFKSVSEKTLFVKRKKEKESNDSEAIVKPMLIAIGKYIYETKKKTFSFYTLLVLTCELQILILTKIFSHHQKFVCIYAPRSKIDVR